jgi:hypothetical protein
MTMMATGRTKTGNASFNIFYSVSWSASIRGRQSVTRTRDGLFLTIANHSFTIVPPNFLSVPTDKTHKRTLNPNKHHALFPDVSVTRSKIVPTTIRPITHYRLAKYAQKYSQDYYYNDMKLSSSF